jgi:hypothetical protein
MTETGRIPNAGDDEYAGTELETPQQRERRAAGCCGHTGYGCSCGPACRCGCPGCPSCRTDPAREIGRQRAAELSAASGDENWLGA